MHPCVNKTGFVFACEHGSPGQPLRKSLLFHPLGSALPFHLFTFLNQNLATFFVFMHQLWIFFGLVWFLKYQLDLHYTFFKLELIIFTDGFVG